mgnify:FL=1
MPNFFNDPDSLLGGFVTEFPLIFAAVGMGFLTFVAFILTSVLLKVKDK